MADNPSRPNETQFSLTKGDPIDHTLSGLKFTNTLIKKIVLITVCSWLPLLILSAVQGLAIGKAVSIPFLLDISTHTRLLLVIPLLLIAEPLVEKVTQKTVEQFLNAELVREDDIPTFTVAVRQARRWQELILAELVLLGILVAILGLHPQGLQVRTLSTWIHPSPATSISLSLAGYWWLVVTLIYRFLALRWIWRFFIWFRLLWQLAQLPLQLVPTHPDRTGGLAFLGDGQARFGILLLAASTHIAGAVANQILYAGKSLYDFQVTIAFYTVGIVLLVLLPLLAYVPKLFTLKEEGQLAYGVLTMAYSQLFDRKWIGKTPLTAEMLAEIADFSALADLGASFQVVKDMSIFPLDFDTLKLLVLATVLPFIPLVLSIIPLSEILARLRELLL
jgi:hypothetical protein